MAGSLPEGTKTDHKAAERSDLEEELAKLAGSDFDETDSGDGGGGGGGGGGTTTERPNETVGPRLT